MIFGSWIGHNLDKFVASYADDTYVLMSGKTDNDVIIDTEISIKKRVEFLKSMGIIAIETKTDLMWIGPTNLVNHHKKP